MNSSRAVRDPRYFQIFFQSIFLGYGILFLSWQNEFSLYITYFLSCISTQFIAEFFWVKAQNQFISRFLNGLPSALITAFGLSLLLKTNDLSVAFLAGVVSIASKYFLRVNRRHVFNPSALGIVAAVWLTGRAWINPGQWGSSVVLVFGIIILGSIITSRIQKVDISLAFLGTFALLLFVRQVIYLGWPIDFFIQSFSTGSLLIFSFFMISDPKTIPAHRTVRIFWGVAVAAVAFYFTAFQFINGAPILILVLAQPIVPVLNKVFKAQTFEWFQQKKKIIPRHNPVLNPIYISPKNIPVHL